MLSTIDAIDLSFQKCVGDQCNSQGCDGVAPANCESFLDLIFDRIGRPAFELLTRFDTGQRCR